MASNAEQWCFYVVSLNKLLKQQLLKLPMISDAMIPISHHCNSLLLVFKVGCEIKWLWKSKTTNNKATSRFSTPWTDFDIIYLMAASWKILFRDHLHQDLLINDLSTLNMFINALNINKCAMC